MIGALGYQRRRRERRGAPPSSEQMPNRGESGEGPSMSKDTCDKDVQVGKGRKEKEEEEKQRERGERLLHGNGERTRCWVC